MEKAIEALLKDSKVFADAVVSEYSLITAAQDIACGTAFDRIS